MTFGFIILRCVKNPLYKHLWIDCYKSIRKFYKEQILIIDDGSDPDLIDDYPLENCIVKESEIKGRAEILTFFYFYRLHPFDRAVILHDSMTIEREILQFRTGEPVQFLWHFYDHKWDDQIREMQLIVQLDNWRPLMKAYHKRQWLGCFGAAAVIDFKFLSHLVDKYCLFRLISHVRDRPSRMAFERVFGVLCCTEFRVMEGICGNIYSVPDCWVKKNKAKKIPGTKISKIWCGR